MYLSIAHIKHPDIFSLHEAVPEFPTSSLRIRDESAYGIGVEVEGPWHAGPHQVAMPGVCIDDQASYEIRASFSTPNLVCIFLNGCPYFV